MRDIRKDLTERLAGIEAERKLLKEHMTRLGVQELTFRTILEIEEARWATDQRTLFAPDSGEPPVSRIRAFLLEAMSDGQPWTLDRLKQRVIERKLELETDRPGSALHGALVSMKRTGLVELIETGVWKIANIDAPSTEADEAPSSAGSA